MQKNNTYEFLIQVHFQQNIAKFSLEVPKFCLIFKAGKT